MRILTTYNLQLTTYNLSEARLRATKTVYMTTNGVNVLITSQNFVDTFCLQTFYRLSTDCLQTFDKHFAQVIVRQFCGRGVPRPYNRATGASSQPQIFNLFSSVQPCLRKALQGRSVPRPPIIDCRKAEKNLYYESGFFVDRKLST